MSVFDVSAALGDVSLVLTRNSSTLEGLFGLESRNKMSDIIGAMRRLLLNNDIAGFNDYTNKMLADEPDLTGEILDQLFAQLNVQTRDELSALLSE